MILHNFIHTKTGDRENLNIQVNYKVKENYLILYIDLGAYGHILAIKRDYTSQENDGIHCSSLCNTILILDIVT